jgi:beta-lactamase regulating signal transducer with metallopeptidase domain
VETLLHAGLSNAVSASVLAIIVACLGRVLARRPAVLHCLWLLVLLKLVTPPLYQLPVSLPERPAALPESQGALDALVIEVADRGQDDKAVPVEAPPSWASLWRRLDVDWSRLFATIWLAGSVAAIVVATRRIVRFRHLLNDAEPAAEEIQDWVAELATNLGLERPPSVWWTGAKVSPMLWALGRYPRLIIPLALWKSLDDRQRSTLVVHELAHLRRGDHRVRIFELVVTTLYWWHPVPWWARRALRDVEEQCCDAWVVWTFPDAARSYAETLLETLDFLNQSDQPEPLLASGFGKVRHLRRRLTMIMSGSTSRAVSLWGALGAIALAALLLPVSPTWAQKPPGDEKQEVVGETVVVGEPESKDAVVVPDDGAALSLDIAGDIVRSADGQDMVKVAVVTDQQPAVVVSGSLEQAIAALKEQLNAIKRKSPLSESDKKRAEGLARALEEVSKVARQVKALDLSGAKDKDKVKLENKRIVIRKLDLDKVHVIGQEHANAAQKAEADKRLADKVHVIVREHGSAAQKAEADKRLADKEVRYRVVTKMADAEKERAVKVKQGQVEKALAEVEKVRSKVDQLTKELNSKRRELSAANAELSRLRHIEARVVVDPSHSGTGVGVGSGKGAGSVHGFAITAPKMSDSDRQRLADLEKKLDKLLEEVASLKRVRGH